MITFDASITIGPNHLVDAGLDPRTHSGFVVSAIRDAVARIPGAAWIDVEVEDVLPSAGTGVDVYPPGFARTPNTSQWRQLRGTVEDAIRAAVASVAARARHPAPVSVDRLTLTPSDAHRGRA